jgi:hypothetical protein
MPGFSTGRGHDNQVSFARSLDAKVGVEHTKLKELVIAHSLQRLAEMED